MTTTFTSRSTSATRQAGPTGTVAIPAPRRPMPDRGRPERRTFPPDTERGRFAVDRCGTGARRRAAGIATLLGGALTFAGFVTTPWEGSDDTAKYLQTLADHPRQAQVAAVLLHFGYLMMVPMVLALGAMVRRRAVALGNLGLFLGVLGGIGLPGLLVVDFYGLELAQQLPVDQAVAIEDGASGHALAGVMAAPSLIGLVLGVTLLMIAAARAQHVPWWAVPLFPVGFVFCATPTLTTATIGGALVLVAMFVVGTRTLLLSDQTWETGR